MVARIEVRRERLMHSTALCRTERSLPYLSRRRGPERKRSRTEIVVVKAVAAITEIVVVEAMVGRSPNSNRSSTHLGGNRSGVS